ncbi:MAG: glycoside hydrolase family 1 protein [Sphingomonadales bacterium]|nr:MAG: glycoside hydrolase family 1 protein [Sphingomonadales bacterium]
MERRELLKGGAVLAAASVAPGVGIAHGAPASFPPGFLWGASTAGHQVEGNNVSSDYWVLEHITPAAFAEPSGDAVNSLDLWPADLDLVRGMGLNTYRFSLEWARIEPEQGRFSAAMLDHYARMIGGCRERGITPVVTFNHFTCPRWFTIAGGWRNPASPDLFARFCERAAKHLAHHIGYAVTLNEPNLPALLAWTHIPPSVLAARQINREAAAKALGIERFDAGFMFSREEYAPMIANLAAAHKSGRQAIKSARPDLPVGMALAVADDQAVGPDSKRDAKRAEVYGPWLEAARDDEFIGVQNYTRSLIDATGQMQTPAGAPTSSMRVEIYPPSLAGAVRYIHAASKLPVLITEHGVATGDDRVRAAFIPASLALLQQAIAEGVPVLGYIHWALVDNFEWYSGYTQQFGLAAVDRTSFARTPKPSAAVLGAIARRNALAG